MSDLAATGAGGQSWHSLSHALEEGKVAGSFKVKNAQVQRGLLYERGPHSEGVSHSSQEHQMPHKLASIEGTPNQPLQSFLFMVSLAIEGNSLK